MNRILIIEDDKTLVDMYTKLLSNHGYAVLYAEDGEIGLSKALDEHPDLILLDLKMPKMDGMTVLNSLRKDQWGKDAMVIILTNFDADDKSINEVVSNHPSFYLVKTSTTPDMLLEKIEELLENKE